MNEEDKCVDRVSSWPWLTACSRYGAVVRGQNAYIPPGARKQQSVPVPSATSPPPKADVPKVSVNGPDGTPVAAKEGTPPAVKSPSPTPSTSSSSNKVSCLLNIPILIRLFQLQLLRCNVLLLIG